MTAPPHHLLQEAAPDHPGLVILLHPPHTIYPIVQSCSLYVALGSKITLLTSWLTSLLYFLPLSPSRLGMQGPLMCLLHSTVVNSAYYRESSGFRHPGLHGIKKKLPPHSFIHTCDLCLLNLMPSTVLEATRRVNAADSISVLVEPKIKYWKTGHIQGNVQASQY